MTNTFTSIASYEGRIAKIQGPARSGKTQSLIDRCINLLEQGKSPESILVTTTTAQAASRFKDRLNKACAETALAEVASQVNVLSVEQACVYVLDTLAARTFTNRVPRILNSGEYLFFLEDMKTLGQPIRRLRKMLDHFYHSMSNLVPESEWLFGTEEEVVLNHAISTLKLRHAILPHETAYLCANFLRSPEGVEVRGLFDYVLADDFQNASYAEQTALCCMAHQQIMVAGNPNELENSCVSYPYAEGFNAFDTKRKEVEVFTLDQAFGNEDIIRFTDSLCSLGDMDSAFAAKSIAPANDACTPPYQLVEGIQAVKWATPEDELNGLTKFLRAQADKADEIGSLQESRICIVTPNKRWATLVAQVLGQRGFGVSKAGAFGGLSGDPRETNRARALVAFTKLNLLANETDPCAWRSWCGFDNHLTNSDAWSGLEAFASENNLNMVEALQHIADSGEEPFLRADALVERWNAGQSFIEKNRGRRGFALLRAIEADTLSEFEEIARMLDGDETAEATFALAQSFLFDPVFPPMQQLVHIATYGSLSGCDYDYIFALAAVDGLIPNRNAFEAISTDEDRDRIMNANRRSFANTLNKARYGAVLSYFNTSSLDLAERSKMLVTRVRAEGDERVAIIRPCSFIAEAGNAAPSTRGGQALLGEYGLN